MGSGQIGGHSSPPAWEVERSRQDHDEVVREGIRQICLIPLVFHALGPMAGASLLYLMQGHADMAVGAAWLVGLVVNRVLSIWQGRRLADHPDALRLRHQLPFLTINAVYGLQWGILPLIWTTDSARYEFFLLQTVVVVGVLGVLVAPGYRPGPIAVGVPLWSSIVVWGLTEGTTWGIKAAIGACLIAFGASMFAMRDHALFRRNVLARVEIERLAGELFAAQAETEAANAELRRRNEQLDVLARQDTLTGAFNRRHFFEQLESMAQTPNRPWVVAIVDADHFKRVNDTHGHATGDAVLVAITETISAFCRPSDCVARLGGEEFGLLISDATTAGAVELVDQIRTAVAHLALAVGQVTISAGVAEGAYGADPSQVVARADAALYAAKHQGRNRVAFHGDQLGVGSNPLSTR